MNLPHTSFTPRRNKNDKNDDYKHVQKDPVAPGKSSDQNEVESTEQMPPFFTPRMQRPFCFVTDQDRSALSADSEVGVMYDVGVTAHVAPPISGSAGIRPMFAKCTA